MHKLSALEEKHPKSDALKCQFFKVLLQQLAALFRIKMTEKKEKRIYMHLLVD